MISVSTDVAEPRPGADELLSVEGLCLSIRLARERVPLLDEVSFTLRRGRCLGLVGESGSGKTITALAVMGLLPRRVKVDRGRVLLSDPGGEGRARDLVRLPRAELRRIRGRILSMIFQDPMSALNPYLRIGEQLIEALKIHRRISRRAALDRAQAKLQEMGIPDARSRMRDYPHQLSGGMCQRVLLAMALLLDPEVLIADEPTTALDVTIQAQILTLLDTLKRARGMAILLITHDWGLIADQTDRVLVVYAGSIMERAATANLFAHPAHPYTIALRESRPSLAGGRAGRLPSIAGNPPRLGESRRGCPFAPRCPHAMARCNERKPPLFTVGEEHDAACWLLES